MGELHPATCLHCCKRVVDSNRRAPELVRECFYALTQLIALIASLIAPQVGALLLILQHNLPRLTRERARRMAKEMQDLNRPQARYHDVEHLHATPMERQIIYQQHRRLAAIERALKRALKYGRAPEDAIRIRRELESAQAEHDEYANHVHIRSWDRELGRDV